MKKEMTAKDENKLFEEIKTLIQNSRNAAYNAVSSISVMTYWNIGKKIVEEEQNGKERAQYGERLIEMLAEKLTKTFGASFNKRNLQYFRKFYLLYLDLEIVNSCVHNLTWTHIRRLLSVANDSARLWYTKEASEQMWSVRTLTHQDIGQMDMYIRMYDDLKRKENDNPTIGIVLCSETDKDIARYSILHDSSQIFMAKYMPFMPTPEELKAEIEKEKTNFYIQHPELAIEN